MLKALGIFSGRVDFGPSSVGKLEPLRDQIPLDERVAVARYLRSGSMVMAWMEYTVDCLNGAFGVPGGSAIMTDGTYYWRLDAAEYVETYGIGLPQEFLELVRQRDTAPTLTHGERNAIYALLVPVLGVEVWKE